MNAPTSGYHAPLALIETHRLGAWTVDIGTTPDGKFVAEYTSTAAPKPQRHYADTLEEIRKDASWIIDPKPAARS